MIRLQNVTKRYYRLVAVDDVTFTIPPGEVVGVLGPNGAGKTTLFKLIAGFLNPDEGAIECTQSAWPAMGFKPERLLFPNRMRVKAYLAMIANLSNIPRHRIEAAVMESLSWVGLTDAAGKRIKECSKGMRQRLALAQSFIGHPPLLLLDEPTNGLDPEGQSDICEMIQSWQQAGHTIVLASHQLQEVTRICTYLVILNQGRIHYQGQMSEALALRPHVTIQVEGELSRIQPLLASLHPQIDVEESAVVLSGEAIKMRRHVISLLVGTGFDVLRVEQKRRTLEEIYAEAVRWHNG